MTQHLKALATVKPMVKLHDPGPIFEKTLDDRVDEEMKHWKDPELRQKRFMKKLANDEEYAPQREMLTKVAKAKPRMENKKPPETMKLTKVLSNNKKKGTTTEKFL